MSWESISKIADVAGLVGSAKELASTALGFRDPRPKGEGRQRTGVRVNKGNANISDSLIENQTIGVDVGDGNANVKRTRIR